MKSETELKSIIDDLANNLVRIFSLDKFRVKIKEFVKKHYDAGLEKAEIDFGFNFVRNDRQIQFLEGYTFDLVKGVTDEMVLDIRQELKRGMLNNESILQIKNRLDKIFKGDNPTRFRYEDRLRMIARTETTTMENAGHLEGAKQSGVKLKKYLSIQMDERTSPICIEENKKYGSPEKAIPLDEEFVVKVNGKEYRGQQPSFHTNCRTRLLFVEVKK